MYPEEDPRMFMSAARSQLRVSKAEYDAAVVTAANNIMTKSTTGIHYVPPTIVSTGRQLIVKRSDTYMIALYSHSASSLHCVAITESGVEYEQAIHSESVFMNGDY